MGGLDRKVECRLSLSRARIEYGGQFALLKYREG